MAPVLPFDPDRPLSYERAAQRIKTLWKSGNYRFTKHAQQRLLQRGFSDADIRHLINYGRVTEHSRPAGAWRYRLSGQTVDGHRADAFFEVEGNTLALVTVLFKRELG